MGQLVKLKIPAGNIKPSKAKSPNKIDPAISLANAFHVYMLEVQENNLYLERGLVTALAKNLLELVQPSGLEPPTPTMSR